MRDSAPPTGRPIPVRQVGLYRLRQFGKFGIIPERDIRAALIATIAVGRMQQSSAAHDHIAAFTGTSTSPSAR